MGFILRRCSGKGPHLVMMGKPRGFSLVVAGFSSFEGEHREPLVVPQGSPVSTGVVRGTWGLLSSHCRANRPHLGLCPETPCSSPVVTGTSGFLFISDTNLRVSAELKNGSQASSCVEARNSTCSRIVRGVSGHIRFEFRTCSSLRRMQSGCQCLFVL